MIRYKQCVLRKQGSIEVAWIPEMYAHKNKFVQIKKNKEWDDGWQVLSASEFSLDESSLADYASDYKHQRKMSDI